MDLTHYINKALFQNLLIISLNGFFVVVDSVTGIIKRSNFIFTDFNKKELKKITDELLKVQSLTAKGFGILNTFPTTIVGRKNLEASQVSIIVSNAVREFPDDSQARQTFINQKLYHILDGLMI